MITKRQMIGGLGATLVAASMAAIIGVGQLIQINWRINSQLTDNVLLAKREPGWAALWASCISRVSWLGWMVLAAGIVVILFAGLPNKAVNPSGGLARL